VSGRIAIGSTLEIHIKGVKVTTPQPTAATAAALILLAHASPKFVERKVLARKIYPGQEIEAANNALRQTLYRLRQWLGPDLIITQKSSLKLSGTWLLQWSDAADDPIDLIHPALERIQPQNQRPLQTPSLESHSITDLIIHLSHHDQNIAREVLVASGPLLESSLREPVLQAFKACKPLHNREPRTIEYFHFHAIQSARFGNFRKAASSCERAFRIARHQNKRTLQAETSAGNLFYNLESGNIESARNWLAILKGMQSIVSTRLLLINAETAYHWNLQDGKSAMQHIQRGIKETRTATRRAKVHFYCNAAVCYAEFNELEKAASSLAVARQILSPGIDIWHVQIADIAQTEILLRSNQVDQALAAAQANLDYSLQTDYPGIQLYLHSQLARIYKKLGNIELAKSTWHKLELTRRASGGTLNPRLIAQKADVFGP
jgi:tetratricopeptide (TPR) repeat protein